MQEPAETILLYPVAVVVALAIQWNVLIRPKQAEAAVWKGAAIPSGSRPPIPLRC